MPDGDPFERKLRAKGSRSVYRLGCFSAPVEAVVDKIMSAAAHLFRSQDPKVVREVFQELQDASQLLTTSLLREGVSEQAFDQLSSATMLVKETPSLKRLVV